MISVNDVGVNLFVWFVLGGVSTYGVIFGGLMVFRLIKRAR